MCDVFVGGVRRLPKFQMFAFPCNPCSGNKLSGLGQVSCAFYVWLYGYVIC